MKTKIISMILLVSMVFSLAAMGMVSSSAADYPYHIAEDWTDKGGITDQDYSFAFIGDIQKLTEIDYLTSIDDDPANDTHYVDTLFTWLAENAESKKIKHIFSLGDLTEFSSSDDPDLSYQGSDTVYSEDKEWKIVKDAMSKLDGVVSYSVVRGNHDDYQIDDIFGYDAYKSNFDGFYDGRYALSSQAEREATYYTDSITNSYKLVEIDGTKYIFITLDFNPTRGVVTWLDEVLTTYSDHKAIITTHAYTWRGENADGTPKDGEILTIATLQKVIVAGKAGGAAPDYIWKNCLKKHSNVIMTVSGHVGSNDPFFFKSTGDANNEVLNVLVNPQSYEDSTNESKPGVEPTGMVFLMHFNDGGNTIRTEYYSTILDSYKVGQNSKNGSNNNLWSYNGSTWNLGTFELTAEMTAPPATEAPATEAPTTAAASEEATTAEVTEATKKGCKSSVSLVAIALLPAFATFSAASLKKRKEND